ncbi:MAG TPA: acyltransferase family protein [Rhizomicrobium sp.]|nr:acyltransferase family protein [Rhizomicrobium sp.]
MENLNRAEAAGHRYRSDIDGLRAVAVVPVVLYHYGVTAVSGGFVGVDIFFVISGFLITSLIYTEIAEGRFSIVRFYERRIRRIFPALFAVLIATSAVAAVVLFPEDFRYYSESLFATVFFASNFEFWRESDYFATAAALKPLLHTWSLAVEEQFYLIFPLLLHFIRRVAPTRQMLLIALIFALSFVYSAWSVKAAPVSAFYLAPARIWELLLGSLLAIGRIPVPQSVWARNAVSVAGIAAIGWAIFTFTPATPFPGPNALFPCVGAALVIYAGSSGPNVVSGILGSRPFVFIGLISYSLYLWHWPLIAFARYYGLTEPAVPEVILLLGLAAALSVLSWRYIETPFRKSGVVPRSRIFRYAAWSMAAAVVFAIPGIALEGLPQRYSPDVQRILAGEKDIHKERGRCFLDLGLAKVRAAKFCRLGDLSAKPDFLLWGDSHSDAIFSAVEQVARESKRAGYFAGQSDCPPLIGDSPSNGKNCAEFVQAVADFAKRRDIKEVILVARWALIAEGTSYPDENGTQLSLPAYKKTPGNHVVFSRGFNATIAALITAGKKVIVVGPIPEVSRSVPESLAKIKLRSLDLDIRPTAAAFFARQNFVLRTIKDAKQHYGITLVFPSDVLCDASKCNVAKDGKPLYRDDNHLNVWGAEQLVPLLRGAF